MGVGSDDGVVMGNLLHVCLYNTEPEASQELETAIGALNFVRLVAKASTPEKLAEILQQHEVNLVFFHLDPDPHPVVEVIEQVSTRFPSLAQIALSHRADPDSILAPIRAGCDQFVCEPIEAADLASAVSRVASKRLASQPKSRYICVTGASGGAGATSIACNLALEIGHLTEHDCALVDLNLPFGDVTLNFDCEPEYTIYDLGVEGTDLDTSILESALETLPCKVAILARPQLIEQQEFITADTVHRVLELLASNYENVVIDVPRDLSANSAAALTNADLVLIICQLLVPSIHNARRYHEALLGIGVPEDRIEIVVNRGDAGAGRVNLENTGQVLKKPVYMTIPNDYEFVARSIDLGRPIAALDRNNPVRVAIRQMAQKITSKGGVEAPVKQERRGLLSRLLIR